MKRLIATILIVVLALGVFTGCGGGGGGSGKGYDAPLRIYVKMLDGSMSRTDLRRLLPEESWEVLAENEDMSQEDLWEQLEPMLEMVWAMLDKTYGKGYRVTYKVVDEELIDEDDDLWPAAEEMGLDPDKLTKAYALEVEFDIKGSKAQETIEGEGVAFCYDGAWYATMSLEDMGSLMGAGEEIPTTSQNRPVVIEPEVSNVPTEAECEELMDCWVRLYTGKMDEDDVERMYPADFWEHAEDEMDMDIDDAVKSLRTQADDKKEQLRDTFGSNVKITYEILDRTPCDEEELEELQEECEDIGLKARKVTGACYVELEITVKGSKDKQIFDSEAVLYQYDGQWYFQDLDLDELNEYID